MRGRESQTSRRGVLDVRSRRKGSEANNGEWKEAEDKDRRTAKVGVTLIFQDSTSADSRFDSRLVVTVVGLCVLPFYGRGGGSGGGIERSEEPVAAGRIVKRERFVWRESPPIYTLSGLHPSSASASAADVAVVSPRCRQTIFRGHHRGRLSRI